MHSKGFNGMVASRPPREGGGGAMRKIDKSVRRLPEAGQPGALPCNELEQFASRGHYSPAALRRPCPRPVLHASTGV
jgi:hypothetical protein